MARTKQICRRNPSPPPPTAASVRIHRDFIPLGNSLKSLPNPPNPNTLPNTYGKFPRNLNAIIVDLSEEPPHAPIHIDLTFLSESSEEDPIHTQVYYNSL